MGPITSDRCSTFFAKVVVIIVGLEKSERCPNNSSLFQPLAAVVVVAVQVLFRTEKEKPVHTVYWFFLVQECNSNPNHFPRMQLLSLLQR